ncbi:myb-like protein I, partial [Ochlerotatus camptorhynchus]|uniref:myb-like protein I n=1 Tax=Ochlerotatus camptorhynchus TaxID=644619 RepID=UPI0031E1E413
MCRKNHVNNIREEESRPMVSREWKKDPNNDQQNGLVENYMKIMNKAMATAVSNGTCFKEALKAAVNAHNAAAHAVTGVPPEEANSTSQRSTNGDVDNNNNNNNNNSNIISNMLQPIGTPMTTKACTSISPRTPTQQQLQLQEKAAEKAKRCRKRRKQIHTSSTKNIIQGNEYSRYNNATSDNNTINNNNNTNNNNDSNNDNNNNNYNNNNNNNSNNGNGNITWTSLPLDKELLAAARIQFSGPPKETDQQKEQQQQQLKQQQHWKQPQP